MQTKSPCDSIPRSMHSTSKKMAAKNPEAVRPGGGSSSGSVFAGFTVGEQLFHNQFDHGAEQAGYYQWKNTPRGPDMLGRVFTTHPEVGADLLKGPDIWGRLQKKGYETLMQCNKASTDGYPAAHAESENSTGYSTPGEEKKTDAGSISYSLGSSYMSEQLPFPDSGGVTMGNDAKLQAKSATVKSWACVNFSSVGSGELLKFLRYLGRICFKNGMDFGLEPTMLVHRSSPCRDDMVLGLYSVRKFFDLIEMEKGEPKFLLVILPDARCCDDKVENICKDIEVVYQCCLPPHDRVAQKKYLENVANEIQTKVMEFIDSCNDTSGVLMGEYDGYINEEIGEYDFYSNEEMGEYDGYDNEVMGEGDGDSCEEMGDHDICMEMESVHLCSHNELGEYTSEKKRSEASHSSSEQELLSAEDFTTTDDGILQAKSANITWACVNFSRISGKEILSFLHNLGNTCISIGLDLSLEPAMLIHMNSSHETDFGTCLWTVSDFFNHLGVKTCKTLVVIILPDAKFSHVDVEHVCRNLGLVYQLCMPRHARRANVEYVNNAANKIKAKLLPSISGPCEYMYEDDPEEFYYSDEGMGKDGSESDDYDVEMSDNSLHESGRHDFAEKLPGSDKTTEDDTRDKESDHICGLLERQ